MEAIRVISKSLRSIGTFEFSKSLESYGTLLDNDYCLNWWHNEQANKIEMHLFTPLHGANVIIIMSKIYSLNDSRSLNSLKKW